MEEQDLFEAQVAEVVREYGQRRYSEPPADMWARLAPQLTVTTPWWRRLFALNAIPRQVAQPPRRFALGYKIALLVLAVALIGGGSALAATNTWESLLHALNFQNSVPAASGGNYTEIHQQVKVDGVTVTLENASANATFVVTSFTIVQPMNSHISIGDATLTLKGTDIQVRSTVMDNMGVKPQDGMSGNTWVIYFPAKTIPTTLKTLQLHFSGSLYDSHTGKETGQKVEFDFTIPAYAGHDAPLPHAYPGE